MKLKDGLYVSPKALDRIVSLALEDVHRPGAYDPRWDGVPVRETATLEGGAWILWLDGKVAASGEVEK